MNPACRASPRCRSWRPWASDRVGSPRTPREPCPFRRSGPLAAHRSMGCEWRQACRADCSPAARSSTPADRLPGPGSARRSAAHRPCRHSPAWRRHSPSAAAWPQHRPGRSTSSGCRRRATLDREKPQGSFRAGCDAIQDRGCGRSLRTAAQYRSQRRARTSERLPEFRLTRTRVGHRTDRRVGSRKRRSTRRLSGADRRRRIPRDRRSGRRSRRSRSQGFERSHRRA